jgi:hypothetical protein
MTKKKEPMVTVSEAEYALLNYEASMFYEHAGIETLSPTQEAKLRNLDRKANP